MSASTVEKKVLRQKLESKALRVVVHRVEALGSTSDTKHGFKVPKTEAFRDLLGP